MQYFPTVLGYNIFLTTLVIRQHLRGNSGVWTSYVTETDFAAVFPTGASSYEKMQLGQSVPLQFQTSPSVTSLASAGMTAGYAPQPQVQQHQMARMMVQPTMSPYPQV